MLMLNLHSVDSIDDPVQVAVRKSLLACLGSGGADGSPLHDLDYLRSVLRGVLMIHSTRHYEYSACVVNRKLDSETAILDCFRTGADMTLLHRPTSEGRFFLRCRVWRLCGHLAEEYHGHATWGRVP